VKPFFHEKGKGFESLQNLPISIKDKEEEGKSTSPKTHNPSITMYAKVKRKAVDIPEVTNIDSTMKLIRTRRE
jgi:hypothetical protein